MFINGPASSLRRTCIVSATALYRLYNGRTIVLTTALQRFYKRLCNGSTNGSARAPRLALQQLHERLYNSSTIAHIVTRTIVGTNGSASSLRRLYHFPYSRPYNRRCEWLCIVSINGSATGLQILYERPYDGSASALRTGLRTPYDGAATALERLYERPTNGSATVLQRLYNGSTTAL